MTGLHETQISKAKKIAGYTISIIAYPLYQPHLSQINKVANLCHYEI